MLNKKQSSRLWLGMLSFLMVVLLSGFLSTSAVYGQTVDTVNAQDTVTVSLANKATQDSVVIPNFKIAVSDTLTVNSDSVKIGFANNYFKFGYGPYAVTVNGSLIADSARVNATFDSLFIKIKGANSFSNADTLTINGVAVIATHTNPVYSDASVHDSLKFAVGNEATGFFAGANPGTLLRLLPGSIYKAFFTTQPATPITAGVAFDGGTLNFQDRFNNVPNDKATSIGVTAILNLGGTANGTLTGMTTITKTASAGAPGTDTYHWTALSYTRAETIQLVFTAPGGSATSNAITVNPAGAANISVSLTKTTIDVNTSTTATLTATDANGNPISGATITAAEKTNHGGTFGAIANTDASGVTTATFTPSHFFVGTDTLQFKNGAYTQNAVITINPGALGRVYVDYSGTADGSKSGEAIAAGTIVYARGFLADTYGNPINASATTDVTFAISGVNGKGTKLGTPVLTTAITEAQYPNQVKTAIAVAIPYTVSTNVRVSADSVLATAGSYSGTIAIQNRSNVPAKLKMFQSAGSDSSVVVSNLGNSIAFSDSVWDQYGNAVTDPGNVKIAPKQDQYLVYFTTNSLANFIGTANSSDTTVVDTLLPASAGLYTRALNSGKKSGLDTIKTWAAASASVSGSTIISVTPAAYSKLVITPHINNTAIAGQTSTLTAEKQDTYGNHIDFGLTGNNPRGNTGALTVPTAVVIHADSALFVADTVTSGHNRGGTVTQKWSFTGKAGVASVGGTLDITFPFVAYTSSADTQKVYASFGGINDTAIVYSKATGGLSSFLVKINNAGSHFVGDSVSVTITAQDSNSNRIYTYYQKNQTLTLDHSDVMPVSTKDTTYYFSFSTPKGGKYVKTQGNHPITDTMFNQGVANITLWKFHVDSTNTVTINGGGFSATSAQSVSYKPLLADSAYHTWSVTLAKDTLIANSPFDFTVTPRDKYYNVAVPKNIIVNIASNQTSGFNIGSNPKVVNGATSFTGTLSGATDNLLIYVFNSDNSQIYGQSSPATIITGVDQVPSVPKVYSLAQNFPNPFNPSTTIRYELPKAGLVTLKVYDILGREVASLVNEKQAAGKYSVDFNANKLASGVYIYRIQSGDFTSVKKLMLLK